jgi:tRNA-2-methylthio-N6-dimethylallyladenosine synthase
VPDAAITADVIVGFPGESEEAFENTLSLMREVEFEQVNTAAYSPRPNTPAAEYEQHTDAVKQDRLQKINRLATEHALNRSLRFVGRTMDVLVEDVDLKNPSKVKGRIPHGRLTYLEGNYAELKGKIVRVKILEARPYHLLAERVPHIDPM